MEEFNIKEMGGSKFSSIKKRDIRMLKKKSKERGEHNFYFGDKFKIFKNKIVNI